MAQNSGDTLTVMLTESNASLATATTALNAAIEALRIATWTDVGTTNTVGKTPLEVISSGATAAAGPIYVLWATCRYVKA